MQLSIFLAKVLGIYLLVMGLAFFLNRKKVKEIVTEIDKSPALMMLSGLIPLMIGALITVSHEIWTADWRILISILGWVALIKGIIRVAFPAAALRYDAKLLKKAWAPRFWASICLVLGIFLCLAGFMS